MHNYLIKDEFIMREMKLWNFIFDKELFKTSISLDTKKCTLLTALGLPEHMTSQHYVLALKVKGFS